MPADESSVADAIELQPFYHHVKNTIVRPKQVVVGTRYFWEKWAPRLGPTLTVLVVRLRMHCYYNQATQERRDWCFPTQQTLAEEVGVSRWTVMRELKKSEARRFVRVQYRSRYDQARRQTVRISSLYHVAMDDPLVEEDQGKAAALLAANHLLDEAEGRNDAHCGLTDPGREVVERPVTGKQAKALVTDLIQRSVQTATGPTASKLPPEREPEEILLDADAVARELIQEQVSTGAAYRLASQFPAEHIRDKMALVRQLKDQQQELRNVPGFLRRAIEEDYQAPLAATGTDGGAGAPLLELRSRRTEEPVLPPAQTLPRLVMAEALSGRSSSGNVWQMAKSALAAEMRPAAFAQWLEPSNLLHYRLGQACIVVPDARIQRYIEQRLRPAIEAALAVACGGPTSLEVVVEGENPNV
jgi:AraC-like DNA-binding protein